MAGLSFSNLFVDITNRRTQETSRQLSQVTGALDQIAGHKKQVRLATEREETLKDNEEFKLQKRQQGLLVDNMDILGQYSDEDISGFTGVDPKTGENLGWTNQTMDIFEQDIAGKRVTAKKEADEIELKAKDKETVNKFQRDYGETPTKDEEGNWWVDGKDADDFVHDYNKAKNIKTATATLNKMTKSERDEREWFSDKGIEYPENNIKATAQRKKYQAVEEDVADFPSNLKSIYENITFKDGKPVRQISKEEYKDMTDVKGTWFSHERTVSKFKSERMKKDAVEKDGKYEIPIDSDYIEDELNLTSKEGKTAYKRLMEHKKDTDYIDEFDTESKEGEVNGWEKENIQSKDKDGKITTYNKAKYWKKYKEKYPKVDDGRLRQSFEEYWTSLTAE